MENLVKQINDVRVKAGLNPIQLPQPQAAPPARRHLPRGLPGRVNLSE